MLRRSTARRGRAGARVLRVFTLACAVAGWAGAPGPAAAASATESSVPLEIGSPGSGVRVSVPLRSFKAMRDANVVKQAYDYSCGAAALATLLTYGMGDETTERGLLEAVLESLPDDENAIRKEEGLSLLDLKRVAEARGYRAAGFKLRPEQLVKLSGPVIVFIRPRGYEHFAVLRGIQGDRIYLADPSRGNIRQPFYAFRDDWAGADGHGVIFVVQPEDAGMPSADTLFVSGPEAPRPELLSVRQMLEIAPTNGRLLRPAP